jgi:hypothetical protein
MSGLLCRERLAAEGCQRAGFHRLEWRRRDNTDLAAQNLWAVTLLRYVKLSNQVMRSLMVDRQKATRFLFKPTSGA